jgi:SAM-dependent methyltransferase
VPALLAAAEVASGGRVLDVATGTGEAALGALAIVGVSGTVIGADISVAMVEGARGRLDAPSFLPVAADGQALPFGDGSLDAVICQLGLQFFSDPALALREFRRVLRIGSCAAACVVSIRDRASMWGILAGVLSTFLPDQRNILDLSFALAHPQRLENLFAGAGFRDIRVGPEKRADIITGFDNYWDAIETGTGSLPQLYLSLSEADRHSVREKVRTRLSRFESDGGCA